MTCTLTEGLSKVIPSFARLLSATEFGAENWVTPTQLPISYIYSPGNICARNIGVPKLIGGLDWHSTCHLLKVICGCGT